MTQYLRQQKQEARLAVLEAYNSCEIHFYYPCHHQIESYIQYSDASSSIQQ